MLVDDFTIYRDTLANSLISSFKYILAGAVEYFINLGLASMPKEFHIEVVDYDFQIHLLDGAPLLRDSYISFPVDFKEA